MGKNPALDKANAILKNHSNVEAQAQKSHTVPGFGDQLVSETALRPDVNTDVSATQVNPLLDTSESIQTQEPITQPGQEVDTAISTTTPDAGMQEKLTKSEHKYSVLEGKYRKEVKEVKDQSRTDQIEIQRLTKELATAKVANASSKQASLSDSELLGLSPEVLETMDADYITAMRTIAQAKGNDNNTAIQTELETLKSQQQQNESKNIVRTFERELASHIPTWSSIYSSSEFSQWVEKTGRKGALSYCWGYVEDMSTVIDIFKAYERENDITPVVKPTGSVLPEKAVTAGKMKAPSQDGKPVYSTAQVREFYRSANSLMQKGKMTREQFNAKEREIELATTEGRVR